MNPNLNQIPHPRKAGSTLSKLILLSLESLKALDTDQIWAMHYRHKKTGRRMAQMKMYSLYKQKKVKRVRFGFDQPFIYYIGKRVGQWEHVLAVNWVYIWFKNNLQPGEKIVYWKAEVNYKFIRPDGLCGIQKEGSKNITYWFIELDRAESRNTWDKIEKYNDLYEARGKPPGFPCILCVTTEQKRIQLLKEKAGDPILNRHNLKFIFRLLDTIIEEAR